MSNDDNYEVDFDPYNRQLLDEKDVDDNLKPEKYHAAKRDKLGLLSTACLIINRVIGTGIFAQPSNILKSTGSPGIALLLWCIGALIAFSSLLAYLELGLTLPRRPYVAGNHGTDVWIPRSGGEKNYLEWIYKRPKYFASCVYAVIFILLGHTAANSLVFSDYILECFNNENPSLWTQKAYAIVAITLACVLHGVWRVGGIWVSNIFAFFKVTLLLFIIILGFAVRGGAFGEDKIAMKNLDVDHSFDNAHSGISAPYRYAAAILAIRFSFGGYENAHYVMGEIDRPQKKLKYSTMGALALVSVLYFLTNIAYLIVVPEDDIFRTGTKISVLYFNRIFGENSDASRALPALLALSAFGNIIAVTFVSSKVKQEIAKEGILPWSRFWARQYKFSSLLRSPRPREEASDIIPGPTSGESPIPALLLHWVVSVIFVISPQSSDAYALLSNLFAYTIHAMFGLLLAGGLLYKRYFVSPQRRAAWRELRGFKPWFGPFFPTFFLITNLFCICAPWIPPAGVKVLTMPTIPWYVFPTIGWGAFTMGAVYWGAFRYIVPVVRHKVLNVKKVPYFDRDVFVLEAISSQWVFKGGPDDDDASEGVSRVW